MIGTIQANNAKELQTFKERVSLLLKKKTIVRTEGKYKGQLKSATKLELAKTLNFTERSLNKHLSGEVTLSLNEAISIADYFGVSIDYMIGRTDYTHVENEAISEVTGLSDESIETLRYFNSFQIPPTGHDDVASASRTTIDGLNLILSGDMSFIKKYRELNQERDMPIESIFLWVYRYVFARNEVNTERDNSLIFIHPSSGGSHGLSTFEIFQTYAKDRIFKELEYLRKLNNPTKLEK